MTKDNHRPGCEQLGVPGAVTRVAAQVAVHQDAAVQGRQIGGRRARCDREPEVQGHGEDPVPITGQNIKEPGP